MNENLKSIANILTYYGPSIYELILDAEENKDNYKLINKMEDVTILEITSMLPYELKVIDEYMYNMEGQMIRHKVFVGNNEKTIFDMFGEAKHLILKLDDISDVAI